MNTHLSVPHLLRLSAAGLALAMPFALVGCSSKDDAPTTTARPSTTVALKATAAGVNLSKVASADDVRAAFAAYDGPFTITRTGDPKSETLVEARDGDRYGRSVYSRDTIEEVVEGSRCWTSANFGDGSWNRYTLTEGSPVDWSYSPPELGIDPALDEASSDAGFSRDADANTVTVKLNITAQGQAPEVWTYTYTLDDEGVVKGFTQTDGAGQLLDQVTVSFTRPDLTVPDGATDPASDDGRVGCLTID